MVGSYRNVARIENHRPTPSLWRGAQNQFFHSLRDNLKKELVMNYLEFLSSNTEHAYFPFKEAMKRDNFGKIYLKHAVLCELKQLFSSFPAEMRITPSHYLAQVINGKNLRGRCLKDLKLNELEWLSMLTDDKAKNLFASFSVENSDEATLVRLEKYRLLSLMSSKQIEEVEPSLLTFSQIRELRVETAGRRVLSILPKTHLQPVPE